MWRRQCTGTGSLVTFTLREAGEAAAFRVLDSFRHMKLAVSLGGIETLVEHPYSMTHADMTAEEKLQSGIGEDMIRLSVGLEDVEDLILDLGQALQKA